MFGFDVGVFGGEGSSSQGMVVKFDPKIGFVDVGCSF
jgi:hypothetical protein